MTHAPMHAADLPVSRAARTHPAAGAGHAAGRRRSWLESMGRRLVARALERVALGGVVLEDGGERVCAPGVVRGRVEPLPGHAESRVPEVRVHDPRFYSAAAFGGSVGLGEAYMDGHWTCDDLPALIETLTVNAEAMRGLEGPIARLLLPLARLRAGLRRNTRAGSRRNIRAHYDLSNEFFALFLDPTMSYSCAIFERGAHTLEAAQVEKIDRACRTLGLTKTDHLLEIGTGWGALAIHAATKYGCRVTTTTISDRQHEYAARRIALAGLSDRITLLKQDYRDLRGQFDKLVSIEMIEAVGREHLDTYFGTCARLLKPSGAALIQAIVIRDQFFEEAAARPDFLKTYIFPGSCLLGVEAMLGSVRRCTDLRPSHLEDIGPHYATTLACWRERFLARLDDVRGLGFDERFVRMWDYYLAYCQGVFAARRTGDVQLLLVKPMHRGRAHAEGPPA
ncbi:MAG: class I SAM-dependent methyltransferase [Phycisphaerales bacterium]